jgi:hypothetical protein
MMTYFLIIVAASFMIFDMSWWRFGTTISDSPVQQKLAAGDGKTPQIRGFDFSDKNAPQRRLKKSLQEVSGLAFTDDGRLLCHGDEAAYVYEIDYRNGAEKKRFGLGRPAVVQDFEGIAVKKDTVFLVASNGVIFRCREGANGENVRFQSFRSGLDVRYDVEGLAYDPDTDCLLLACKAYAGRGIENQKAVYAFSLRTYKLQPRPRFLLPLNIVAKETDKKEFNPSGIERHPMTGNFFVIASNGLSIVELSPEGEVVGQSYLPKLLHKKPEGIAVASDGTLVIANEGGNKDATLVIYKPIQKP